MISEKYGKEAYKIVLDLELVVSEFQSKLDTLISETATVQALIENLDSADPNTLQSQLNELSSVVNSISSQQQSASSSISSLSTELQELASAVLNLQTSLQNYVLKTTTVNGKSLSGNITLTYQDVGLENMPSGDVDTIYDN